MNILIVDDTPTNLRLLRMILESEGHDILEARDGQEAMDILANEPVDAAITDLLMPRLDGYRLCYEVRKNDRMQAMPIITRPRISLPPMRRWPWMWGRIYFCANRFRSGSLSMV